MEVAQDVGAHAGGAQGAERPRRLGLGEQGPARQVVGDLGVGPALRGEKRGVAPGAPQYVAGVVDRGEIAAVWGNPERGEDLVSEPALRLVVGEGDLLRVQPETLADVRRGVLDDVLAAT